MEDTMSALCLISTGIFLALAFFSIANVWYARDQRSAIYLTLDDDSNSLVDVTIPIAYSSKPGVLKLSEYRCEILNSTGFTKEFLFGNDNVENFSCSVNDTGVVFLYIEYKGHKKSDIELLTVLNEVDRKFIEKYIQAINRRLKSRNEKEVQKQQLACMQQQLQEECEREQRYQAYEREVTTKVLNLLENDEIVIMASNLIDSQEHSNFTNISHLISWENFLLQNNNELGDVELLSSAEQRNLFRLSTNFSKPFSLFHTILQEQFPDIDEYITYKFIYSVAVEHYAKQWNKEHYQWFENIEEMSLEAAIEQYCLIDTIDIINERFLGIFTYYLISNKKFPNESQNYILCREIVNTQVDNFLKQREISEFAERLKLPQRPARITINDIDLMDGAEFELFVGKLFAKMGYSIEVTQSSRDQGIDVIAVKNGVKVGIQAKCYSSTVGNSAIQEVVAGKNHYRLDKAMVVTNNFFTNSAQKLALSNSVVLWDRSILDAKIKETFYYE